MEIALELGSDILARFDALLGQATRLPHAGYREFVEQQV